jgi:hypothetical protein
VAWIVARIDDARAVNGKAISIAAKKEAKSKGAMLFIAVPSFA